MYELTANATNQENEMNYSPIRANGLGNKVQMSIEDRKFYYQAIRENKANERKANGK
jgi:hypothetical protein